LLDPRTARRVLIVNPFGVGDAIFTMPLAEVLREAGVSRIGFLCNERTVDLIRMDISIDKTYVFNRDRYRKLWKKHPFLFYRKLSAFLSLIKEERYDSMLDLSLGRQYGFFGAILGIRERVGFDYKRRGTFLTRKIRLEGYEGRSVAVTQLDLLDLMKIRKPAQLPRISLNVPESARIESAVFLKKNGWHDSDRFLAVAPGGGRSWGADALYKQWDPERFAAAADEFCLSFTPPLKTLILGDRSEAGLLENVRSRMRTKTLTVSFAPLDQAAALLLRSDALLCNDGGLMHLANALGVKTVSIFGPVDEKVYGPFGGPAPRQVLIRDVPCRPCYAKFHFPPCLHERRCLTEIPVRAAVEALKKIA